ncbi:MULTISPECIES: NAD(P)-dependent oxidoreductase [unclassified Dyella]|uniref:NAD(P)-dependent oxidoreductase n=1 Tax=unclassified Dyella TaxID=2634549 RepID=UPI000C82EA09|nr:MULTISPECIES: NAD(P)-dependent oxidoreductase [unclassified Dyella]MDR3443894.1 NAD(P)-dependent oxidoreductase [Dyella sp.]PMQ05167.1 2-hydroxy-3-oxopropionate reductase [Dyella sp. AD56]
MTLKAAFIGLGAMGTPMAGHLKAHGLLHAVASRTQSNADAVAKELGVAAPSLADIAQQCDVIALCVTADADVLNTVDALAPHLKKGAIVVDHSTVAPDTAKQAAAKLAAVGAHFLDAPVSGGVEGAKNGKLSVMVGGDAGVLDRARPVLEAYALRVTHLGDVGAGQATKAVNQVLVAGIAQGVCEGLALAEALGLDPERLLPTLGAGAAGNWFLEKRGATMLRNEFSVGFKLGLLHKDLGIVRRIAENAGTSRNVIERSLADYAELMSQGYGDDDISGLIRLKRKS